MAIYDEGGMGAQPVMGGAMTRKPRKGGSAAAMPGQMTNTAMPGTQQLSQQPLDASGNTAPAIDNPMGSGAPMQGFQQGVQQIPGVPGAFTPQGGQQAFAEQMQGGLEGYRPGPMQFGGAPGAAPGKPGKGGGAAAIPGGGVMPPGQMGKPGPGLGSLIRNRVGALRGRGGMGGGIGGY